MSDLEQQVHGTTQKMLMTHQDYIKPRDEIVPKCINPHCDNNGSIPEQVSEDEWVQAQCEYCFTVRFPMQQAIDELVLGVIGKDEPETYDGAFIDNLEDIVNKDRNKIRTEQRSIVKGGE